MKRKAYGCLTVSGIVTALLFIAIVVLIGMLRGGELFSPGPLNGVTGASLGGVTSHAELASKCGACHAPFWQEAAMADLCKDCHKDITAQLQNPAKLHGNLEMNNPGTTCRDCHPDHKGTNASLTDMSKTTVTHIDFGYSLNAHPHQADGSTFLCSTCHGNSYTGFDQAICSDCHQGINAEFMQAHLQLYGGNCLACHDGVDTYGHNFNHSMAAFTLTGKHSQLACAACHNGARSLADLKSTPEACSGCHQKDDPHSATLGSDCGSCHTTTAWMPATFDHNLSGFKLTGSHAGVACTGCHINNVFKGTPTDCYSCHAKNDAHKGQFGTQCDACHTTTAWLPATFNHNLSGFPLTGAHASLACSRCHTNNVFTTLPTSCSGCHADPAFHAGLFAGTPCSDCHSTFAWLPATYTGPHPGGCDGNCIHHGGASCNDCHTVNLMTATCTKCHDSNNPGGG